MAKPELKARYNRAYDGDYVGLKRRAYIIKVPGQLTLHMIVDGPHGVARTRWNCRMVEH